MADCFIGIDVGTGSVRAGVFDATGALLGMDTRDITLHHGRGSMVVQSSTEIWNNVCEAVRAAVAASSARANDVKGVGFDATCSLVVLGASGVPLAVGPDEDPTHNIIVWMDHRAVAQADRITETGHAVLDYVGGRISPEMQTPKLLWLKENLPGTFDAAWQFFDLADYLGWKATGSLARSACTVTCKWTYLAHESRWDPSFFHEIGLGALADAGFSRIGTEIVAPGTPLGKGLTVSAASDLGLDPGTAVAAGLIDAHAGGVGTVGGAGGSPQETMAYVFGTSSCTMTTTEKAVKVPGIWGPYYSAMVPGGWLLEGGQSVAGAAMARLVDLHPASREAQVLAKEAGQSVLEWLADRALDASSSASAAVRLATGLHVVPEFLGNRAPFADPHTRAVISGLGMDDRIDRLVALYIAGICGVGYGLRQIIAAQAEHGAAIDRIVISGGAGRSSLVRQILADAAGLPIIAPATSEPVLLGSAILGATACGAFPSLSEAMSGLSGYAESYLPERGEIAMIHEDRFSVFEDLQNVARKAASI